MITTAPIVLIDCENLTSVRQLESLGRWAGAGRFELFGRESAMAPWRKALARRNWRIAAETLIPDDAPSQAADQAIALAVRILASRSANDVTCHPEERSDRGIFQAPCLKDPSASPQDDTTSRFKGHGVSSRAVTGPVVIASNDKGFAADIAYLQSMGMEARQDFDLDAAGLLRLVVAETAGPDGWASGGGVGDHLVRRFGLPIRGRLGPLAVRAGLSLRHGRTGLLLALPGGSAENQATVVKPD